LADIPPITPAAQAGLFPASAAVGPTAAMANKTAAATQPVTDDFMCFPFRHAGTKIRKTVSLARLFEPAVNVTVVMSQNRST
jgi:hypothetical protein